MLRGKKLVCDSSFLISVAKGDKKVESLWNKIKRGEIQLLIPSISFTAFCSELLKASEDRFVDVFLAAIRTMLNVKVIPIDLGIAMEAGHFVKKGLSFEAAIVIATASMHKVDGIISINKREYVDKVDVPVFDGEL